MTLLKLQGAQPLVTDIAEPGALELAELLHGLMGPGRVRRVQKMTTGVYRLASDVKGLEEQRGACSRSCPP